LSYVIQSMSHQADVRALRDFGSRRVRRFGTKVGFLSPYRTCPLAACLQPNDCPTQRQAGTIRRPSSIKTRLAPHLPAEAARKQGKFWKYDDKLFADQKRLGPDDSKQHAEELALAAAAETGVELVIVNPAGVYGDGPGGDATSLEHSLLRPLIEGRRAAVPMLPPGGMGLAHISGLAAGQLLAAERGQHGERYILCDGHMSFRELAQTAVRLAGRGVVPPVMPVPVARALATGGEALARLVRRPPLLPKGQLYFFLWDARPQSAKAQRELGWTPTPLEEGLAATVAALG